MRQLAAAVLLFVFAFAVRSISWPLIFAGQGGAFPFGNDAYYHLRRIWFSITRFPEILTRDSYVAFPDGGEPIWTPAFDSAAAFVALLIVGPEDRDAVERLVVFLPPLLGALSVVGLYWLALRVTPGKTPLIAALILCILPAGYWYTQLGFVDHHAAVELVTTYLFAVTALLLRRLPESVFDQTRWSLVLGTALGLCILVWPGCLLHVAIVEVAIWIRFLLSGERRAILAWGNIFAGANAVAAALVAPACLGRNWEVWGSFSPVVLSNFQPIAFAASAGAFALLCLAWRSWNVPYLVSVRLVYFAGALGIGLAIIHQNTPDIPTALEQVWSWFSKSEQFQAGVGESSALFAHGLSRPTALFGRALYLTPFLIGAWAWRERRRPEILFICGWATVLFAATLVQRRFMNTFSIVYALILGRALCYAFDVVMYRVKARRWHTGAVFVSSIVILVFLFEPSVASYGPQLQNIARVHRNEKPLTPFLVKVQRRREFVARWLESNTPTTAGYLDPSTKPEYGILAPWSFGHVLQYVAERPAIQDNFGDDVSPRNFALAREYYETKDEADAVKLLESLRARYVIVRNDDREHTRHRSSMLVRLNEDRGRAADAPALAHHRLILESLPLYGRPGEAPSHYKVFELIAGARLRGHGVPGAEVVARLQIRPRLAASFEYLVSTTTGSDGRYEFVLPYPSESFSTHMTVDDAYRIRSRGTEVNAVITDTAAREGAEVEGPDFRPVTPTPPRPDESVIERAAAPEDEIGGALAKASVRCYNTALSPRPVAG